jgi:drug/metabolite transporter (DMT)-like permease
MKSRPKIWERGLLLSGKTILLLLFFAPLKKYLFLSFSSGILHMVVAVISFSLMNVFVKLAGRLPVMELVFFRCGISTFLSLAVLISIKENPVGNNHRLLILRGVFGTIALLTYFITVKEMPLGTAVTIQYLSPIFTAMLAMVFLKEKIRNLQWLFFLISFSGVVLIKGFDPRISAGCLATGIFSALASAAAYNFIRTLSGKEHPLVVVLHFQLIGAVTGLMFSVFGWVNPQGWEWFYLLMIGITTQLGQVHLTKALQKEKAASVSIIQYLGVVLAVVFGVFIFHEHYSLASLIGLAMVVAGVVMDVWMRSSRWKKISS